MYHSGPVIGGKKYEGKEKSSGNHYTTIPFSLSLFSQSINRTTKARYTRLFIIRWTREIEMIKLAELQQAVAYTISSPKLRCRCIVIGYIYRCVGLSILTGTDGVSRYKRTPCLIIQIMIRLLTTSTRNTPTHRHTTQYVVPKREREEGQSYVYIYIRYLENSIHPSASSLATFLFSGSSTGINYPSPVCYYLLVAFSIESVYNRSSSRFSQPPAISPFPSIPGRNSSLYTQAHKDLIRYFVPQPVYGDIRCARINTD